MVSWEKEKKTLFFANKEAARNESKETKKNELLMVYMCDPTPFATVLWWQKWGNNIQMFVENKITTNYTNKE